MSPRSRSNTPEEQEGTNQIKEANVNQNCIEKAPPLKVSAFIVCLEKAPSQKISEINSFICIKIATHKSKYGVKNKK